MAVQYTAWPENFVWPYLASKGLVLYKDIFYIYPPLYFWLLSFWDKIFGISLPSLQALTYLTVVSTDILLYFAAKKKIWPVLVYIPLQIAFEGNALWPDLLLAPLFLGMFIAYTTRQLFLTGVILGLAILTKQTALYVVAVLIVATRFNKKFIAGVALPILFTFTYLFFAGNLVRFYEQNIVYILSYHTENRLQQLWPTVVQWLLLAITFLPVLTFNLWKRRCLLVFLTITAALGIFTRFSYFHLQPALPFLAILITTSIPALIFYVIPLALLFRMTYALVNQQPRFLSEAAKNDAKVINNYIAPGEKTLIMTANDHYYWLTGTVPVGNFFGSSIPWNFNYPGVQERTISSLKAEKPKYVVFADCFEVQNFCYQPEKILQYVSNHYKPILKLSDGASIFEYDPVGLRKKVQP